MPTHVHVCACVIMAKQGHKLVDVNSYLFTLVKPVLYLNKKCQE